MPTTTSQPTSPPITERVSDKVVAAGMYVGNTALVTAAPALGNDINPSHAGGLAVSLIGDGITTIVQALKMHGWYKQNVWAVWTCIILSIVICIGVFWIVLGNPEQAILNAFGAMYKAATNYAPLNKLGVLAAGTDVPPPNPIGIEGEPKQ